jgi:CRP/FNR family cyclic AMP-dependent transcriptional regulator
MAMNLNEEVEVLKGVPIFAKMETARLKLIAFTSERMNYAEGQELCHQGDQGDAMFVILGGVADVLIDTETGQIRVAQLKKNDFLGEIAVLCDVPRTATIKASEPLSTLKITKDMFYRLVAEFPQMAVEVMRELAHRLEDTNQKLREATQKLREATKAT